MTAFSSWAMTAAGAVTVSEVGVTTSLSSSSSSAMTASGVTASEVVAASFASPST
jgi:hypothetical protein